MFGLEGKVIFVTGGNRGIGAAIVELLNGLGANVAYTYRSTPGPDAALAIQADVTNLAAMAAAVTQVETEVGPIYGVVLNAGITKDNLFSNISVEDWYAVIDTNLNGIFNTLRPIVPKLYEHIISLLQTVIYRLPPVFSYKGPRASTAQGLVSYGYT